jgi:predicted phage terminase large subunit-like protein
MLVSREMQRLDQIKENRDNVLREAAWNDLYVFAKFVCGFDLMEEEPHREVCEILMHGADASEQLRLFKDRPGAIPVSTKFVKENESRLKKLMMLPRGSFKSTIATCAYPIWLLWHNQDLRIMIDSETLSNAKKYLSGIKDMIENNELLRRICVDQNGKYVLEPNYKIAGGCTEDQVILKSRKILGRKEPSIFCSGADNAQTGMHPDVILMDDMVSERNVGTADQIEKVKNHYRFSLSLLEPNGLQIVIGTRYHMDDLYGDLLDMSTFECYVRPAVLGYDEEDNPILYFPSRLTKEFLKDKREEQGSYIFSSQYMLSPLDDENSVFKKDHIKYYYNLNGVNIKDVYLLVDFAISERKTADYTVVMAVGVSELKEIYVLEYKRKRMLPNETIDTIFDYFERFNKAFHVKHVGLELVSFQKVMKYFVKEEMKRRGIFMPIKELKADRDKMRRIGALQPLFEQGLVYIKPSMVELEQELLEFPYSRHDDTPDALAYIVQLLRVGGLAKSRRKSKLKINSRTGY